MTTGTISIGGAEARRRHGAGFWLVATAFLIGMAFSTVPTPLYPLYAQRDSFSTFVVTVVFAVYAVGVMTALVLVGRISDAAGRKRVLVPALALESVAAVLFIVRPDLPGLLLARFVTGLGVGMLSAAATAYLHELHGRHRPERGSARFEIVSTAANIGGLGVGPLIAGVLAESTSAPLVVPYAVFLVLLLVAIGAVALAPETVERRVGEDPRSPRPTVRSLGAGFWVAAGAAFASFSIFGVFTSVAPAFLASALDERSSALSGAIVFLVFGAAAVAQTATSALPAHRRLMAGILGEIVGLCVVVLGMTTRGLPLFLLGGALAGAAAGILFKGAVGTVVAETGPAQRGAALSALFLVAYLGLIVPVLGMGIAALAMPAGTAMLGLSAVLVLFLLWLLTTQFRPRR